MTRKVVGTWDVVQSIQITFPPYFLIGIVNFPNGNFDNFDLRSPGWSGPVFFSFSVFLKLADAIYKFSWTHYFTTFEFFKRKMPFISRNNKIRLNFYGTFQNPVIRFVRLKYM